MDLALEQKRKIKTISFNFVHRPAGRQAETKSFLASALSLAVTL